MVKVMCNPRWYMNQLVFGSRPYIKLGTTDGENGIFVLPSFIRKLFNIGCVWCFFFGRFVDYICLCIVPFRFQFDWEKMVFLSMFNNRSIHFNSHQALIPNSMNLKFNSFETTFNIEWKGISNTINIANNRSAQASNDRWDHPIEMSSHNNNCLLECWALDVYSLYFISKFPSTLKSNWFCHKINALFEKFSISMPNADDELYVLSHDECMARSSTFTIAALCTYI